MTRVLLLAALAVVANLCHAQAPTVILGRPTDRTMTFSVRYPIAVRTRIEYGRTPDVLDHATEWDTLAAGTPRHLEVSGLPANTRHHYRLRSVDKDGRERVTPIASFMTQRAQRSAFRFIVEADEHLYDKKGVGRLYERAIANMVRDSADLVFSLGDTFGDDHTPESTTLADMDSLHRVYLRYLHPLCSSAPFFFCLGNHEGENGFYLTDETGENIAVYGTLARKKYYANPIPNTFYSGNMRSESHGMGLPENYYAFTWGDALFVVLDVYRHCEADEKPQGWDWTLGEEQYQWLRTTLATATSPYRFVFAHHTRGQGRGGVATARGYEWGGWEPNKDRYEFDAKRPGWEAPIHELFKRYGVTIFFQGHDHLYAREELDGIVYQEVPMPSDSTYEIGVLANADAYTDVTRDGSGHLVVDVGADGVRVRYVQAVLPEHENGTTRVNGAIGHEYTVTSRVTGVDDPPYPDAAAIDIEANVTVYDVMGRMVAQGVYRSVLSSMQRGPYFVVVNDASSPGRSVTTVIR